MVENKVNWNTVLVVLVIGVVGILLLSNSGILTGNVTGSIDSKDKQAVLNMLSKCSIQVDYRSMDSSQHTCNIACGKVSKSCVDGEVMLDIKGNDVRKMIDCVTSAEQWSESTGVSCRCCSP